MCTRLAASCSDNEIAPAVGEGRVIGNYQNDRLESVGGLTFVGQVKPGLAQANDGGARHFDSMHGGVACAPGGADR